MKRMPFNQFGADCSGSVLVLFGLSFVVLVTVMGAGFDLGQRQLVEQKIQQASDQGALAGALLPKGATDDERKQTALRYFNLNYPATYVGIPRPTATPTIENGAVKVTANSDVRTSFMSNVGISSLNARGATAVDMSAYGSSDYDVVMVVDESGSESAALPPYANREVAQQAALTTMANSILPVDKNNPNVRMGFIGFSGYISNKWGLSSNNADAIAAIKNFRPIYQNFDHAALMAAKNMLTGGSPSVANSQITMGTPMDGKVAYNIDVPSPRTSRTNTSDSYGLSKTKYVVFLSDGGIMIEPNDKKGDMNYDLSGLVNKSCPGKGPYVPHEDGSYEECFAAFTAACNQLKNATDLDSVHVFIVNLQTRVTPGELSTLTACASPTNAGSPTYDASVKPNPDKDFYYAADAATLQSLLTNITTQIKKTRITQ